MVTTFSKYFSAAIVTRSFLLSSKEYMSDDNDQLYISKTLDGDTTAFAVLVNRYKNMVFTLALRILKNKEEAEEVAQDTFVKAYKSLEKFKGDAKFSTWVYKIAHHGCLDRLKKLKKTPCSMAIHEFNGTELMVLENALDILERQERGYLIRNSLEALPGDDGLLLTLFYFEELQMDEISDITGMTNNHIKVKLFRARKRLATILKEQLEPETIKSYGQGNR